MENLSQWFDLSVQKPWETGPYEVWDADDKVALVSFWTGVNFGSCSMVLAPMEKKISVAVRDKKIPTEYRITRWRGLSHPPIDPKHLARRTDPQTSKDAAIIAASTGHIATHCERIWDCLGEHGNQNANEVAARLGLHAHQVLKRFSDLHKMKKASRTGEVRQGQSVWNAI